MSDKENKTGRFSRNILSLKLQLQSLLDEAGGDQVIGLLDSLCCLNPAEQRIALRVIKRVIDRLCVRDGRLLSHDEKRMKELEDFLFSDIVKEMEADRNREVSSTKKFSLVPGGKDVVRKRSIKVADSKKEPHLKPVLN